ncbi:MAG: hypothetical protein GWP91_07750 [Rhodobacterales bacterium]|nr:hypothetical protein [Rhodobacterales bacterium]
MHEKLKRIMYISRARHRMTKGELVDLLAGARIRNEKSGITGLLVYDAGYFAQVLEGPESSIESLLANIAKDPRHDEYSLVSEGLVDERYFEGWSMDWANLKFMDDSRHKGLRGKLSSTGITDRSIVYSALVAFVEEHRKSR